MSAVFLAAAVALPPQGEPDVTAMRTFVSSFAGLWPLAEGSYPVGIFEDKVAAMAEPWL